METSSSASKLSRIQSALITMIPILIVLWIWFSPLSFVPVPWPDDSAFYFVGREFWKWPPRWVMLPQAPFEPTYRIYNFNTMPLYPILIGLGRLLGIDGSFAIKLWPLSAFALTGSLIGVWLFRAGLPWLVAALLATVFALDPGLRWGAVLVRPESLIAFCGMTLVLGLSLGFSPRFRARGLWDPVAALLAVAAYAHFNAIHLLFPVVLAWLFQPKRLVRTGLLTALYLSPWILTVLWHPRLFIHQMQTQWTRLVFHNSWLDSPTHAIRAIFQDMGSPEPWPDMIQWAAIGIWGLMLTALILGIAIPIGRTVLTRSWVQTPTHERPLLLPAAGWVLGAIWLWNSKPEVWFNYYLHTAVWGFAAVAALAAYRLRRPFQIPTLSALTATLSFMAVIFGYIDVSQANRLDKTATWHWDTYHEFVSCIDQELTALESRLGSPKPFRVWCPTFPDVTIELSRRHPEWELTRTNDFWDRQDLAIQHGRDAEAVVVTEMLNWSERTISAPSSDYPSVKSVWMTWDQHFLNRLWKEAGWKPQRYLCQRGRWQAFIFEK